MIASLEIRRDDVLADLDRMCEELAAVIADHRAPGAANAHDDEHEENERAKRPEPPSYAEAASTV